MKTKEGTIMKLKVSFPTTKNTAEFEIPDSVFNLVDFIHNNGIRFTNTQAFLTKDSSELDALKALSYEYRKQVDCFPDSKYFVGYSINLTNSIAITSFDINWMIDNVGLFAVLWHYFYKVKCKSIVRLEVIPDNVLTLISQILIGYGLYIHLNGEFKLLTSNQNPLEILYDVLKADDITVSPIVKWLNKTNIVTFLFTLTSGNYQGLD